MHLWNIFDTVKMYAQISGIHFRKTIFNHNFSVDSMQ